MVPWVEQASEAKVQLLRYIQEEKGSHMGTDNVQLLPCLPNISTSSNGSD
jgi:hypothetical protein